MSKEYEKELERTIEHLHKVIEEKTKLIDQQRELLDKFLKGEISSHPGYSEAPSYQGFSTGPLKGMSAVYTGTGVSIDEESNTEETL